MDDLIKIYESEGAGRIWLQDKLEDENIPYRLGYVEEWTGRSRSNYHAKRCIFVDVKYEMSIKGFIDEYDSVDFSIHEDDELSRDIEDVLPQVTCPACGEKIDLDYQKCPFCKHEL